MPRFGQKRRDLRDQGIHRKRGGAPQYHGSSIRWIQVFFQPDGDKFTYQIANCEFTAHGEAAEGTDKGPAYTHHGATVAAMVKKPGTLYALSLCNIHGLWKNRKSIQVE